MKQPIKPKTMTHVAVAIRYTIILAQIKSTASIKRYILPFSWFTHAIEQMDKPVAPIKAVQSTGYYRQ